MMPPRISASIVTFRWISEARRIPGANDAPIVKLLPLL
jgi:hypothetical protein